MKSLKRFRDETIFCMLTTSPEYLHIGKIMKAAREFKHQNQSQVAALLNCTQGSLSKYEQGHSVLSAPLWFKFCELMEIPYDSLIKGIIDRQIPLQDSGIRSRELFPYVKLIRELKDNDFLIWCLENIGLTEYHAIDFDYSISRQILNNLITILQKNKLLTAQNIDRAAELSVCEVYYGKAWNTFAQSTSPEELMKNYIQQQKFHQNDLEIKADKTKVIIKSKSLNPNQEYVQYKKQCIKLLVQKFFSENLHIEWK